MSITTESLGIDKLSVLERISLAQDILESVAAEQIRPSPSDVKRDEHQRRLAAHETNPTDVISRDEIEAETLARFRQ